MRTIKKLVLIHMMLILGLSQIDAQVTIGSGDSPDTNALLDLKESGTTSTKGLLMPRVALTSTTSYAPMAGHVMGMTIYNTATVGDVTPGYYYNDGSKWIRLETPAAWLISGTEKVATSSTDSIYHLGHVTIGKNGVVDASAILNIEASDKGVLLPRVALTSSTDKVTIADPTTGLLVYNTGTVSTFPTVSYMFWNGTEWRMFANASAEAAVASLNCSGASMSPFQQVTGGTAIISGTVLQIPYTASNGGSFNGDTLVSTGNPNVIAVSSGGMLDVGNGVISFSLSGTPTVSQQAPNGLVFDLTDFLAANPGITGCDEVVVGNTLSADIVQTAVMGRFVLMTDNTGNDTNTQYYALNCTSPDGKFSIRASLPITQTTVAYGNQYLNVQVRNNETTAVPVVWNFSTDYGGSLGTAGVLTIPAQRWGGDNDSGNTWVNATGNNTNAGAFWGQLGIYDAENYGPEWRRYTWIPQGEDNSVAYEVIIMVALDTTTPTTAVPPTYVKCYIRFTQVTAAK